MKRDKASDVEVEILPGISAFQKGAALLGAPIGHDFCIISLSDLMTPWEKIECRVIAAASADFVTAVYNPKSEGRYWQLYRLKELFLKYREPETPVGYIRQAGREEQEIKITTLHDFDPEEIDMFTIVIIGNSQSYTWNDKIITPRGYYREQCTENVGIGQEIMMRSFRTIESELRDKNIPLGRKWALLHAIHTTADFDMENILYTDNDAVETLHTALHDGKVRMIVTDVTMAASGIRKGALERLGIEVKCYLDDPRVAEMASRLKITRHTSRAYALPWKNIPKHSTFSVMPPRLSWNYASSCARIRPIRSVLSVRRRFCQRSGIQTYAEIFHPSTQARYRGAQGR